MTAHRLLVATAIAFAVVAFVLALMQRAGVPAVVADPARTPGVLNPDVTQATIATTICVRGWTRSVRPPTEYTTALKLRQMRAYGETGPPSAFQEERLEYWWRPSPPHIDEVM